MPRDWATRSVSRSIDVDERSVHAIAPCPEDVVLSKLARLANKEKEFIEAYHAVRPLDPKLIRDRIKSTDLEVAISERPSGGKNGFRHCGGFGVGRSGVKGA